MYSVDNRKWEAVLNYTREQNIAFIPWYPLGGGNLKDEEAVHRVAARHGVSEYQIALAWLLAASPVMLLIPGTSSVKHLEENTKAATIKLTEEDLQDMPLPQ